MALKTVTVDVDVDVELSDFSDVVVLNEVKRRGLTEEVVAWNDEGDRHGQMLQALLRHDSAHALELLREYLCDYYGRATL